MDHPASASSSSHSAPPAETNENPNTSSVHEKPPVGFEEKSKAKYGSIVFDKDGTMFFSPNSKRRINIPAYRPADNNFQNEKIRITNFLEPQWFRGLEYVYLAAFPRYSSSLHGHVLPLFKDYRMPFSAVPFYDEDDERFYRLDAKLIADWQKVERDASTALQTLYYHGQNRLLQVTMLGSPSRHGRYDQPHRRADVVIHRAYETRLWFSLYLGALYWCCMHGDHVKLVRDGRFVFTPFTNAVAPSSVLSEGITNVRATEFLPFWFLSILSINPEIQPFLSLMRTTFSLFDHEVSFTGMIIKIADAVAQLHGLRFFIAHKIPVWYPWTEEEEAFVRENPKYAYYRPPASLVQEAYNLRKQSEDTKTDVHEVDNSTNEWDASGPSSLPPFMTGDRPPTPPSIMAGQLEGMTMDEFFSLRIVTDKARIGWENDETRLLRQARERAGGTRNTKVFGWKMNSAHAWIRLRLPSRVRSLLEDARSGYQRRYNAVRDELDFAPTFDPPSEATEESTADDDPIIRYYVQQSRRNVLAEIVDEERLEEDWAEDNVLDIAVLRFGYIPSSSCVPPDNGAVESLWLKIHQGLQLPGDSSDGCPTQVRPHLGSLCDFLISFTNNTTKPEQWDIHPGHDASLLSAAAADFTRLDHNHFLIGQGEFCQWSLVACTPVDALHAYRLRMNGLGIVNIAWHFVDRGIPFLTMIPADKQPPCPRPNVPVIEVRTAGYVFGRADFEAYLRLRRSILRRPGAILAAFKYGGIVWRIARDELGKLSEEELTKGTVFAVGAEKHVKLSDWVDKVLSDEEVATICGVYHVATVYDEDFADMSEPAFANSTSGQSSGVPTQPLNVSHRYAPYPTVSAAQPGPSRALYVLSSKPDVGGKAKVKKHPLKRVSWFPTPDTMSAARKGNLGRWTGKMEHMYQKIVREINDASGSPRTASDWASINLGTIGKHLIRASTDAASAGFNADTAGLVSI